MANSLKIRTLGGLSIRRDGDIVDGFASRKAELLLVYLASNPQVHRREVLAELLWDDRTQRRALGNLRVVLSSLRKVAGPFVTIGRDTAAINQDSVWLDATELENGLAADVTAATVGVIADSLELYRGDFLAGVHVRDARGFEEWLVGQQEHLHRLAVDGRRRLVDYYLETGDYREGIAQVTQLLEMNPLLEAGHRQMMELLARSAQRVEALTQYETCRRLLEEELGVEPAGETVALYEAIRDDAFPERPSAQDAAAPEVVFFPPFLADAGAEDGEASVFVAREPELVWLDHHLEDVVAGNGRLLFVRGEAGTGKTALMHEFARRAGGQHPYPLTAVGRCSALRGAGDPYHPFRQILGQLTGDVEAALVAGDLTSVQARQLWQGLGDAIMALLQHGPDLLNRVLSGTTLLARAEQATPGREWLEPLRSIARHEAQPLAETAALHQQVTNFLQALSREQPLLLLLDDVQWADSASLGLLFHLCHHLPGHRLVVIVAYRPSELLVGADVQDHPLLRVVNEARRRFGEVEQDLGAVVRREGRAFVDQLLDSEANRLGKAFRRTLLQRTGGHPLFTIELLRAMQGRGDLVQDEEGRWVEGDTLNWSRLPAQIEGVIADRIGRMRPELRRLLKIASVEGETFTAQVLARVLEAGERQVLRQLSRELDRRYRLVQAERSERRDGQRLIRYRFRHALFRQYLYGQLKQVERGYLHEDVGLALEFLHGEEAHAIAAQLAYHFRQADLGAKAIPYALTAGDAARTLYAHDEAIEHYRHALSLLKAAGKYQRAARTLMKLGLTHHQAFQYREARQAYEEGFQLWQHTAATQAQPRPPAPHPLRIIATEPLTLDPGLFSTGRSSNIIAQLFAGLVEENETLEIVPDVARRWEIDNGGHIYIFHLRPDVCWSDGAPLTAHDFEFAWKRFLAPETEAPLATLLYDVKGAQAYHRNETYDSQLGLRARDDHTFIVELAQPTAYFLSLVARLQAVPRHLVTAAGERWTDEENLVTSGPFRLESWERGKRMELVRNRDYHRPFRGNIERVQIRHSRGDAKERWRESARLYESDQLDQSYIPKAAHGIHVEIERFLQRNIDDFFTSSSLWTTYLTFNLHEPPFSDVRVRRAFALASDQESFVRSNRYHYALAATGGFVPPGMPGHIADAGLPFDPARARQLLAEGGYPGGNGFPAVSVLVPESMGSHLCNWLAEQWQTHLGVRVDVQVVPFSEWLGHDRYQMPPIFYGDWVAAYPDPDYFLRVGWQRCQPSWHDRQYSRLLEHARGLADQRERLDLYRQAERLLMENAYLVPYTYELRQTLLKPWVKQFPVSSGNYPSWKDVIIVPH